MKIGPSLSRAHGGGERVFLHPGSPDIAKGGKYGFRCLSGGPSVGGISEVRYSMHLLGGAGSNGNATDLGLAP